MTRPTQRFNPRPMHPLASFVVATASVVGALASQPAVTIRNGTVLGVDLPQNEQHLFLGIPYAQPPLGNLRLRRPQPINATFPGGHFDATAYGPHCLSAYMTGFDDNSGFNSSEDCLTLNIVRPYAATEKKPVPVLIWIHGGGLTESGSGDYRFNGTYLVEASVANGHPMVFVSMNYRLAAFGFMGGAELEADGSLNLGMHDQRLAMQWVQENIGRFGGDPGRVTVQGESVCAFHSRGIVLVTHLTAYRGRNDHLFQQAIIQSGVVPGQYPPASIAPAQATFDALLNGTSCASTYTGTTEEKLACVRALPVDEFRRAAVGPVGVLFDGGMVDMISSFEAFRAGRWVKVPLLVGSNTDEGCTFFAPGANTTAEASAAMAALTTNTTQLDVLFELYPDDPALGSPWNTGEFQMPPWQNGIYVVPGKQNKRVAAMTGDIYMAA
ncbi:Ricin B-type lectin domain-containing protein [Mycena chlorophos]|uniref:Ricin B-type lectin domain-containing protein n=1 Tax=Mycena chlorophos TaxID=658473 RepID=A0A8H6SNL6_MYCCL|nr:Ricin B-type lectin domain-containing protein [Mycena chlorophos]